jgi:hypothetical protein
MGTIQQLINDLRAWAYLVADHAEAPSHRPTPQLHVVLGDHPGRSGAPRFDDHPGRAA